MIGITSRQLAMLEYVQQHINEECCPPTLQAICNQFGIKSLRGVTVHLDALERKGYLTRPHTARGIKLTALGLDAVRATVQQNPMYQLGWQDAHAEATDSPTNKNECDSGFAQSAA